MDQAVKQAEYLRDVVGDTDERTKWLAEKWLQLANNGELTAQQAEALANKVTEISDYTGDLSEKAKENE